MEHAVSVDSGVPFGLWLLGTLKSQRVFPQTGIDT